jgi:hypothetical protein
MIPYTSYITLLVHETLPVHVDRDGKHCRNRRVLLMEICHATCEQVNWFF